MRCPLVVAAAILDDLDTPTRMLACRRSSPPALAGLWEFPGGKVEPGEGPEAALHRELREELGIAVRLGMEVPGPDNAPWPLDNGWVMRLWTAVVTSGEPEPLEDHDALQWLPLEQWHDVDWIAADVAIVDHLVATTLRS